MDNQEQSEKPQKPYSSGSGKFYGRRSDNQSGFNSGGRKQFSRDRYPRRDERFQKDRDNSGGGSGGKYFSRGKPFGKKPFDKRDGGGKPWQQQQRDNRPRIVSDMQLTEGKHRGRYLENSISAKVKPTARRIREVMFRIMYRRTRAKRFLDLCAGAGTMGLEAMSRGALLGTFVERSAKMCSYIRKNMAALGIKEGHGEIIEKEVVPFLKQMKKRRRYWDVVYFDPPTDADYDDFLRWFASGAVVAPNGGNLIIEHPAEMFFPEQLGVLTRWRVIVQGNKALSFFERRSERK